MPPKLNICIKKRTDIVRVSGGRKRFTRRKRNRPKRKGLRRKTNKKITKYLNPSDSWVSLFFQF